MVDKRRARVRRNSGSYFAKPLATFAITIVPESSMYKEPAFAFGRVALEFIIFASTEISDFRRLAATRLRCDLILTAFTDEDCAMKCRSRDRFHNAVLNEWLYDWQRSEMVLTSKPALSSSHSSPCFDRWISWTELSTIVVVES